MPPQRPHVVLLGDSIFDNGVYVTPAPDVVRQLRVRLGAGWTATLLAVDGDVTDDVARQLRRLPGDATHLVVSVGGNDALQSSSILAERATSVAEAVGRLAEAQARFRRAYERMVEAVAARGLPVALCTIYDSNYPEPQRRVVVAALALFNDVITRAAFARGLPVIDLRLICSEPADYANPIEPSARGGDKIAAAVAALVRGEGVERRSTVWV
jgi:lysophospholipase L1-like esterase